MNLFLKQDKHRRSDQTTVKDLSRNRSNKNIYTKILFSNITIFLISLMALICVTIFLVKQITYERFKQDLLYKAERINSALFQLTLRETPNLLSEQTRIDLQSARKAWINAQNLFREGVISKKEHDYIKAEYQRATDEYYKAASLQVKAQIKSRQELLKFLVDLFQAKRITIFNKTGIITDTSVEYEDGFDGKVDQRFIAMLNENKITIVEEKDGENIIAVIPIESKQNIVESGILLEMDPPNLEFAFHKVPSYLLVAGISLLMIIIFHSVFLAMNISNPIFRLANAVTEVNRGCDVLAIDEQPLEEVNILGKQLSKLVERLQKVQTESSKTEEERAKLFTEISHELRTPLTSVQGFVEAIRDGMVQDKALLDRYLDTIYSQTVHIIRLVDDILILGRLESGHLTIVKQPLDLITLIQTVITSLEAEANSRNTVLLLEKGTDTAFIIGDVDRMEQIIRNLLKNAIKATENGTIKFFIDVHQDDVVLTIKDTGIGIAADDLPHIWDRFYRAKNQRTSQIQEKGSGLGLVIVKKLVQLQGGTINVESQLGKGSTFTIRFPSFS